MKAAFLDDVAAAETAARTLGQCVARLSEHKRAAIEAAHQIISAEARSAPTTVRVENEVANALPLSAIHAQLIGVLLASGGRELLEATSQIPWTSVIVRPEGATARTPGVVTRDLRTHWQGHIERSSLSKYIK